MMNLQQALNVLDHKLELAQRNRQIQSPQLLEAINVMLRHFGHGKPVLFQGNEFECVQYVNENARKNLKIFPAIRRLDLGPFVVVELQGRAEVFEGLMRVKPMSNTSFDQLSFNVPWKPTLPPSTPSVNQPPDQLR